MPEKTDKQRISVALPDEDIQALKKLAEEQGITATAALRRAIATESFIRQVTKKDKAQVLLKHPDGEITQVTFI